MGKITLNQTGAQVQSDLNLTENMFPNFSTSSTYEADNIVRYQDKLYRCIQLISTAGAWDSSKWEEIKINRASPKKYHTSQGMSEIESEILDKLNRGDIIDDYDWYGVVIFKSDDGCTIMVVPYDQLGWVYFYEYSKANNVWSLTHEIEQDLASSGTKLYKHHIVDSAMEYEFILINNDPNQIDFSTNDTYAKVKQYLDQNPFTSFILTNTNTPMLYDTQQNYFYMILKISGNVDYNSFDDWNLATTTDTVTPL